MSTKPSRTIWIWVLIAGALILGILNLIDAARFMGQSILGLARLQFGGFNWLGALLAFILALIWLSVARQLYNLDPRGWVFVAAIANIWLQMPALTLTVSTLAVLIFSAFILYDLQRVVNGGETNYVTATLSVYLSIYNVFSNLLMLLGVLGGERD